MAVNVVGDLNFLQRRLKRRQDHQARLQETPQLTSATGVSAGMTAWVDQVPFRVGRGFNNHFILPDPGIGALHAVVRRGPTGEYVLVAHDAEETPIFERRWGRYQSRGSVQLKDKTRFRLGRRGPVVVFRYLGGQAQRKGINLLSLGGRRQDPLLPLPHLVERLDEQRFGGDLPATSRYFVDHAVRYLEQLGFYRRWILGWGMILILLAGLIVYSQLTAGQAHAELESARAQLRSERLGENRGRAEAGIHSDNLGQGSPLDGDRVAEGMIAILRKAGVQQPVVDQELLSMVKSEIDRETTRLRRRFDLEGFMARHDRYHSRIQEVFEREYQIPPSLAYIAWVESDYRLDAESNKGALGMWQFMEATAIHYDLITPGGEDYRLNFERSTRAAGQMFSDLLAQFGLENMLVAIAAYNWGPARFATLMRRNQLWRPTQRTFAHMLKLKSTAGGPAIPEESRTFVARFFAVHLIAEDLSFYLGAQ